MNSIYFTSSTHSSVILSNRKLTRSTIPQLIVPWMLTHIFIKLIHIIWFFILLLWSQDRLSSFRSHNYPLLVAHLILIINLLHFFMSNLLHLAICIRCNGILSVHIRGLVIIVVTCIDLALYLKFGLNRLWKILYFRIFLLQIINSHLTSFFFRNVN